MKKVQENKISQTNVCTRTIAVFAGIDKLDGLLQGFHRYNAQHRPEDLRVVGRDSRTEDIPGQNGWAQKITALVALDSHASG